MHKPKVAPIPEDIIFGEILPRLPTQSLLRFKCVCKSFEKWISSAEFIDLHHRQSLSSDTNRLLVLEQFHLPYSLYIYNLDSLKSPPFKLSTTCSGEFSFVGSCNGLICLIQRLYSDHGRRGFNWILLNPFTETCTEITYEYGDMQKNQSWNFGLGFDDKKNDYKLITVAVSYRVDNVYFSDDEGNSSSAVRAAVQVMVYSLKQKDYRNMVDERVFYFCRREAIFNSPPIVKNNHLLHWLLPRTFEGKNVLCCFDVSSEKWTEDVLLPNYIPTDIATSLAVLDGCLCLVTHDTRDNMFCVWSMRVYRVKESWVKLFTLSGFDVRCQSRMRPLAYSNKRRSEVLLDMGVRLVRYNLESDKYKKEEIRWVPKDYDAYICEGSLVTIPGNKNIRGGKSSSVQLAHVSSSGRRLRGRPSHARCY